MQPSLAAGLTVLLTGLVASTASGQGLPDFTGLVEDNIPSVVHIQVRRKSTAQLELPDDEAHSELRERMPNFVPPYGRGTMRVVSGSGFVIDPAGYVLTNHHVIEDAEEIVVRLQDRRELDAELVGFDLATDVALLRIPGETLPAVTLGSSHDLKLGEWVVAIGSPFDFEHSVTAGIVSAKNRTFRGQQYVPFLQTDVPINRGNSGGPLINVAGEVVGINSQIFSGSGGFMGLSFAIPIEVATSVATQLRESGKVARGRLGVRIGDVTRDQAEALGLRVPRGALVSQVIEDSAASRAGLRRDDVILEFNGQALTVSASLPPLVGATAPGTTSNLLILREGQRQKVSVVIDTLPLTES